MSPVPEALPEATSQALDSECQWQDQDQHACPPSGSGTSAPSSPHGRQQAVRSGRPAAPPALGRSHLPTAAAGARPPLLCLGHLRAVWSLLTERDVLYTGTLPTLRRVGLVYIGEHSWLPSA